MADRIIKGDSGNDVIIQNNDASRKIEVTNSGDVEVTGDVKTTTVKATNLKANDGTAGLVVADSTGRLTANEKILVDDIIEKTSAHGVEIEGVLVKDSIVQTDDIQEKTSAHGVEIEGVLLKDSEIASGAIGSSVTMTANQSAVKTALNASGSAGIYACRAWVNFDGGSGSGTGHSDITIRGSGNVTSITDGGTGKYTVNFTTAMPDNDFAAVVGGYFSTGDGDGGTGPQIRRQAFTTGTVGVRGVATDSPAFADVDVATVAIFR
mgnify:CR=1 FL=1